ncbi:MAG: MotA/TolQ/ExbB proton channel family protein [Spirochaetota bacterium]
MKMKTASYFMVTCIALVAATSLFAQETVGEGASSAFSLLALFKEGGPFMWPILALTAVGFGFILERFIFFAFARLASKEFIDKLEHSIANQSLDEVEELCAQSKNKIAMIIRKGLALRNLGYERVEKTLSVSASVEVALLERGLSIISAIANIVPMLGFLGTVTGMITAFNDIAAADQVSAKIVAGGIKEALLTTSFGLVAAIPVLLFYNFFVHRIEAFITNIERLSSDIVEKLLKGKVIELTD